jgi:nitrate reductase NapD
LTISGIVLRARPERLAEVRDSLAALPGVEVHAATGDGRIVLTLEGAGTASAADTFVKLHDIGGVMSVAMIYEYSDSTGTQEARP